MSCYLFLNEFEQLTSKIRVCRIFTAGHTNPTLHSHTTVASFSTAADTSKYHRWIAQQHLFFSNSRKESLENRPNASNMNDVSRGHGGKGTQSPDYFSVAYSQRTETSGVNMRINTRRLRPSSPLSHHTTRCHNPSPSHAGDLPWPSLPTPIHPTRWTGVGQCFLLNVNLLQYTPTHAWPPSVAR